MAMKIRLLSIIALLLGTATQLFAHDFEAANSDGVTIYYNITDAVKKTVCVTYKGDSNKSSAYSASSIEVPNTVEYEGQTYSVTAIGDYAFSQCIRIKSVSLPITIETINQRAFNWCSELTSLSLAGSDMKSIGAYAFYKCVKLPSITIPNSVNSIGEHSFEECNSLTNISLPIALEHINPYAFYKCAQLTTVEIQGNVETIGEHVFDLCSQLSTVSITGNVKNVGSYAFSQCSELQNISIPSVATISDYTFNGCVKLSVIEIRNAVVSIGDCAFYNCESLTSVILPKSLSSINPSAFSLCYKLINITVDPENENFCDVNGILYTKDQEKIIMFCAGRKGDFTISDQTKTIGKNAFSGCKYLTSLVIPSSVTKIESNAIEYCPALKNITFLGTPEIGDLGTLTSVANIYSETTTPQTFTATFPFQSTTKVYVSSYAYEAYKTAAGWKNCNIINCGPFTISANATNCTVTGTGTYDKGSNVTLTVSPTDGYEFIQWSDGNTDNPRVIANITEDTELTVECSLIETPTGISDIESDVTSCEYYDMNGRQLSQIQKGIIIVVKHYADGSITREKQIIK